MPRLGEVKRADEPPIGGRINKPFAPTIVMWRQGPDAAGPRRQLQSGGRVWRRALPRDLRPMRVKTESASTTSELAGYLRRCECQVEIVDDWTLEVDVRPGSLSERHARIELDAYLRVWEAMNAGVSIERLEQRAASS